MTAKNKAIKNHNNYDNHEYDDHDYIRIRLKEKCLDNKKNVATSLMWIMLGMMLMVVGSMVISKLCGDFRYVKYTFDFLATPFLIIAICMAGDVIQVKEMFDRIVGNFIGNKKFSVLSYREGNKKDRNEKD